MNIDGGDTSLWAWPSFIPTTGGAVVNANDLGLGPNLNTSGNANFMAMPGSSGGALPQLGNSNPIPPGGGSTDAGNLGSVTNTVTPGGVGLPGSSGITAGTTSATSDSFVTKIAVVVLGIVLIGGAVIVYHNSKS